MSFPLNIKDQMGRELKFDSSPVRIISLVPSITELLHDLGLEDQVVGVTKFCIHPKTWCDSKIKVGGTKKINFKRISELEPDIIIGNKEENTKDDINKLEKQYKVFMTDVNTFDDALEMIEQLSKICDRFEKGSKILSRLKKLKDQSASDTSTSAIYLIWKDPYFAVGSQTFINDMMKLAGFKNVITEERYPEITIETINQIKPKLLLLSTEPYPFGNKHLKEIKNTLKTTTPTLVDGEMFSWYGSRLLKSFDYFNRLKTELGEK